MRPPPHALVSTPAAARTCTACTAHAAAEFSRGARHMPPIGQPDAITCPASVAHLLQCENLATQGTCPQTHFRPMSKTRRLLPSRGPAYCRGRHPVDPAGAAPARRTWRTHSAALQAAQVPRAPRGAPPQHVGARVCVRGGGGPGAAVHILPPQNTLRQQLCRACCCWRAACWAPAGAAAAAAATAPCRLFPPRPPARGGWRGAAPARPAPRPPRP